MVLKIRRFPPFFCLPLTLNGLISAAHVFDDVGEGGGGGGEAILPSVQMQDKTVVEGRDHLESHSQFVNECDLLLKEPSSS